MLFYRLEHCLRFNLRLIFEDILFLNVCLIVFILSKLIYYNSNLILLELLNFFSVVKQQGRAFFNWCEL